MKKCKYCGGDIEIRNPTGKCDHLYYPENCEGYKNELFDLFVKRARNTGFTDEQINFLWEITNQ